ncbi:hypothetical protein AAVH_34386, partial [Aphelenchoides avenae]
SDEMTNPFDAAHPLHKTFQSKLEEHRSKVSWHQRINEGNLQGKLIIDEFKNRDTEGNVDYDRVLARLLAETRSLRLELLLLYRNQRLPATKLIELAQLRKSLKTSEQQEQQLWEKLQKARRIAPSQKRISPFTSRSPPRFL